MYVVWRTNTLVLAQASVVECLACLSYHISYSVYSIVWLCIIYIKRQTISNLRWVQMWQRNNDTLPYHYISPPAGDIYCSSLRVCPSVLRSLRMSVCYATLIRAISPRNFHEKKMKKKSINNIPTEVVQRKSKFNFAKNCCSFGKKNTF